MKKQYIEPSTAIFTFNSIHIVAQSSADITDDNNPASQLTDDERVDLGGGDNDARGGFGSHSIWDNVW